MIAERTLSPAGEAAVELRQRTIDLVHGHGAHAQCASVVEMIQAPVTLPSRHRSRAAHARLIDKIMIDT